MAVSVETYVMARWRMLLLVLVGLLTACAPAAAPSPTPVPGLLRGDVTIGSFQPVERPGEPTPTPNPEVYAARRILVYCEDGRTLLYTVSINPNGSYQHGLPPGTYVVDINRVGIDSSKDVPRRITVQAGQTVVLDIDIDTGIR